MGLSFSVVIPTHDRLDSLREVLAAVEAQSGGTRVRDHRRRRRLDRRHT